MITPYSIDKIISTAKIEDVLSEFITLKKRGINYVGLCPFHNEKTPSFSVSPTKGIYKCFGCGASGNVVKFLMDHEKLSYPDALRWLAKKYNIIIEEVEETEEIKKEKSEKERILELLNFAQKFFTNVLLNADEGKNIGLNYLYNQRKIDFSLIQKFQLGYSPSNKRAFTDLALQSGYNADILLKAGLVNYPDYEDNKPIDIHKIYDKFSGRVIFPITDLLGKVIGFGGRTLQDDKNIAKYINSPQTIVYDKSKILYGLHLAKKSIIQKDLCYLVEGYADVISLHKAGIENVVASSGTSLTSEQVKQIHRFTNNVVVLYDGDTAGIKASIRAIDMLLEEGLQVKIVLFPDGEDPDSFVNKYPAEQVIEFLQNNEKDFIQFKKELYRPESQNPHEKAKAIEEILTSVAKIPNELQRREYIKALSDDFKTDEKILLATTQKIRTQLYAYKNATTNTSKTSTISLKESQTLTNTTTTSEEIETGILPTKTEEINILKHIIKYGNMLIKVNAQIEGMDDTQTLEITTCEYVVLYELKHDNVNFEIPEHQLLLEEIENCLQNYFVPDEKFYLHHPNPIISNIAIKYSEEHKLSPNWESRYKISVPHHEDELSETIRYLILSFKEKKLRKILSEKHQQLKKAEEENDSITIHLILEEISKIEELKKSFNKRLRGGRTIVV